MTLFVNVLARKELYETPRPSSFEHKISCLVQDLRPGVLFFSNGYEIHVTAPEEVPLPFELLGSHLDVPTVLCRPDGRNPGLPAQFKIGGFYVTAAGQPGVDGFCIL